MAVAFLVIFIALVFEFMNGFNDRANSIATPVCNIFVTFPSPELHNGPRDF